MKLITSILLTSSCLTNAAIFSFSGTLSQRSVLEGDLDGLDGATATISFQTTNVWESSPTSGGVALQLIANSLTVEITQASLAIQNNTYIAQTLQDGDSLFLDRAGELETSSGIGYGVELGNTNFAELFILRYEPTGGESFAIENGDPVTSNQFSSDPSTVSTRWEGLGGSSYNFTPTSASFTIPEPSVTFLLSLSGIILMRRQRHRK